jgi:hypothetical protein
MFREMVPGMVNVLEQCLAESDEENAGKGFEVFDTLLMLVSAELITLVVSGHLANVDLCNPTGHSSPFQPSCTAC